MMSSAEKPGNKNKTQKQEIRTGEPDAKRNPETCFEQRKNWGNPRIKNKTIRYSKRSNCGTKMKPV